MSMHSGFIKKISQALFLIYFRYGFPAANILKEVPNILLIDPQEWDERVDYLSVVFGRKKILGPLITHNPSVFSMSTRELEIMTKFLFEVMHVDPKDIVKTNIMGLRSSNPSGEHLFSLQMIISSRSMEQVLLNICARSRIQ